MYLVQILLFFRPEHVPAGPPAAAEAGEVPGGRAHPRPTHHLCQPEAGGLHPLLRESQVSFYLSLFSYF